MGNQKNIIELNGKQYDALTGKIVVSSVNQPPKKAIAKSVKPSVATAVSMDGFSRPRKASSVRKQPTQGAHIKTESSKTLMRKSVKKPQAIVKQPSHARRSQAAPNATTVHQSSKTNFDPARMARSQQIHKSNLVTRFSDALPRTLGKPSVVPLNVAPSPKAPQLGKIATGGSQFQTALDHATSHQQPKLKKSRLHHRVAKKLRVSPRLVSIGSAALAVLLIGGFITYQNVPNLAMRLASARAGVHASLPSYKPAGFDFIGPIQYKPGQVTIRFKNNTDAERNFSITQSASAWNSETLLENFVAANNQPYQTYEDNGKTIYIYGGSNATWVDGGIWYNVHGSSTLSSDQLLRIAKSI